MRGNVYWVRWCAIWITLVSFNTAQGCEAYVLVCSPLSCFYLQAHFCVNLNSALPSQRYCMHNKACVCVARVSSSKMWFPSSNVSKHTHGTANSTTWQLHTTTQTCTQRCISLNTKYGTANYSTTWHNSTQPCTQRCIRLNTGAHVKTKTNINTKMNTYTTMYTHVDNTTMHTATQQCTRTHNLSAR